MPWLIQHKCYQSQSGESEYAVSKGASDGKNLTRVLCPNPDCREEFFILGHEMFDEAISNQSSSLAGLPPGFLIPRSPKAT